VVASLASLGEGVVVVFEAVDVAVVGDADEDGAAVGGVGEPGDGLDEASSRYLAFSPFLMSHRMVDL
jgi:hypothetical protein